MALYDKDGKELKFAHAIDAMEAVEQGRAFPEPPGKAKAEPKAEPKPEPKLKPKPKHAQA